MALPAAVGAQDYNPNPGTNNGTGVTTTTDDTGGFDWRWLLPLALIPLAFLLFRRNDDEEEDRNIRGSAATYHDIRRNRRDREDERDTDI